MRALFRGVAAFTAISGVIMYIYRALFVNKRSIGSELAEDLIRVANFDIAEVDDEMLDHNAEENRKEYEIPRSVVTSHIESYESDGMKVFVVSPKTERRKQRVLYLHGGGYIHQPSVFHWRFISKLVKETETEFIVPIYPKAPEHTYDEAYEPVQELYKQLVSENDDIIIMGDSAGGGLTLGLVQWLKKEQLPMPKAQIVISPWLDITLGNPDIEAYETVEPMLKPDNLKIIGKIWSGDADPDYYKVSPMLGDLNGLPKLYLIVGTREIILPDARKYVQLLETAGADYEYYEYEMQNHVFPLYPIKEGIEARKQIGEILISYAE
ncbi:putative esterase [Jeotgalicoccus coquinae]|uniref:Acetyl esterase/lipase n=1 Tax=Jeotgalicoccus coquinae TaxID=709509 RepID=A0A6V7RMC5_9STAP|nr:alpha/beta hydrolase [Jeotgalicoccus coquinae]MBB6422149.1 acetyl esterase/lipase [Jeotgalicoccus coquinae]GGE18242.1 putative esterase [Jeotgalicoccus coquinae]CAD2079532.1 Putative acetyl-hydrolase LipR precursor [Jeotgalicoccus coquinae]